MAENAEKLAEEAVNLAAIGATVPVTRKNIADQQAQADKDRANQMLRDMLARFPR